MSAPVIEIEDLWLSRRGQVVLEAVDLEVGAREYLAILGPNGSGKTTLLRAILGLLPPDRGRVRVLGKTPKAARGLVGYVPQHAGFDVDFPIRVRDVVLMGRFGRRGAGRRLRNVDREAADGALSRLEVSELADRPIGQLSGGQLQRVMIARALAGEPQLLLLDEPMSSLDERIGRGVWEILEELSREMAIVIVSHDIGAISRYVGRVACLNRTMHVHDSGQLTDEILEETFGCAVDLLAHGHPHRVLGPHGGDVVAPPGGDEGPAEDGGGPEAAGTAGRRGSR